MPDLTIREARKSDAPAVSRLVTQLGYPSSEKEIENRLSHMIHNPEYAVWVAEADGKTVGLTGVVLHRALEYNGLHGRLLGLVVDEPFRGKGIGEQLMGWTESWLQERGVDKLTLASGKQRTEAHKFYRRLGYEETGLRFGKKLELAGGSNEESS